MAVLVVVAVEVDILAVVQFIGFWGFWFFEELGVVPMMGLGECAALVRSARLYPRALQLTFYCPIRFPETPGKGARPSTLRKGEYAVIWTPIRQSPNTHKNRKGNSKNVFREVGLPEVWKEMERQRSWNPHAISVLPGRVTVG